MQGAYHGMSPQHSPVRERLLSLGPCTPVASTAVPLHPPGVMSLHRLVVRTSLLAAAVAFGVRAEAQTIRGTLKDRETDQPVRFGLVVMLTERGDSVAATLTNASGRFSLSSREPGGFYLKASALAYRETTVGIFDLDRGGEMTLEFRIFANPINLGGILINAPGGVRPGALIANGFFDRMQSGLGRFFPPAELQKSMVLRTSDVFFGIPRVSVLPEGLGNRIKMSSPTGECDPPLWVDGVPLAGGASDENFPSMSVIEAIEVYRGGSELPLQWGGTTAQGCGAIVVWTKR